ncbi:antA/AntB antirepressor family protein [Acinetobacter pollinis]|uniref:AntA/AntB antirepressor family protein n=1 Tax=Acinetobacter pollinis TaxID=2605270 RepID=A0ABU6DSU9_9GAMM|nr:antA/AntB antirepressor family protein [Acinetobacter pollinis]MBF7694022.1 antA/AntB antirepressor family protein [Acinetobacter pollinis]MBF7701651.1 antA/AntB antirepressor family protein [Acinetobacter pollinis]MEB5475983.1 antA/AntB antirepressor family protein [Acinetobacter pollinis]
MNAIVNFNESKPFIEVKLNGKLQLGVDARELHTMLEVKGDFTHWIKRRISQCKFEENFDYIVFVKNDGNLKGGRPTTEYIISVDMAKHLGMMERNSKGHEIRKYYIEQENIARDALSGLQVEIGKLTALADQWTATLSNAGHILSVGGKKIKPKILTKLNELVQQAQHKLDFDESN